MYILGNYSWSSDSIRNIFGCDFDNWRPPWLMHTCFQPPLRCLSNAFVSLHILFLFSSSEVICEHSYLLSTWFPAAALNIELVRQEVYLEAADGASRCVSVISTLNLVKILNIPAWNVCVHVNLRRFSFHLSFNFVFSVHFFDSGTFLFSFFKCNTLIPILKSNRMKTKSYLLSSNPFMLFNRITRPAYIHNVQGLLSIHSICTHSALNWVILCRTPLRISLTPKSGHTSLSVRPPGMDPVPSGMSSESAALF